MLMAPALVDDYWLGVLTQGLIVALFAASLDLLVGYTGLPSMGHAAFYGIAGYATGLLTVRSGLAPLPAIAVALLVAAVAGAAFGAIALRARGVAFLVITLALGQVVWGVAIKWSSLTGGSDGLPGVFRPILLGVDLADPYTFYYAIAGLVAMCLIALGVLVRSPFGLILQGIRESESRMQQLGYATWRYQLAAFVIAAAFAGVAGISDAYYNEFVSPDVLYFTTSATALLIVIMGSSGTLLGPAVFGALLIVVENVIGNHTDRWPTVLGALYIITVLVAPGGFLRLARSHRGPRRPRTITGPEPVVSLPEASR